MIKSVIGGATQIIAKPTYIIPAIIAMIINFIILLFTVDSYLEFFYDAVVFGAIPDSSLIELPFYIFTTYAANLLIIGSMFIASTAIGFYLLYVYSTLLHEKQKSVVKAMLMNISKAGEILGLTIFVGVAVFLYSAIAFLLAVIGSGNDIIGIVVSILLLAWIILGFYAYIKLAFTPLFMAVERKKLKPALARSWKWSEKKIISIIVFLIILGIITNIVNTFTLLLGEVIGMEEIAVIVMVTGMAISSTYYNIAFIKYFLNSKEK